MTYYTIRIDIDESLSPSEILQVMKDGATYWGKLVNKSPQSRLEVKKHGTKYYMKVGYAS